MTSHVQPLDAGIIRSIKARYRRKFVRWLLDSLRANVDRKLNILEAIRFAIASWDKVPAQVIRNCWVTCDIVDAVGVARLNQLADYSAVSASVETELASLLASLDCSASVDDYIEVDASEPIETSVNVVERVAATDSGDDSDFEEPVRASDALASCLRLQTFLAQQHTSDDMLKMLSSLTGFVRKEFQQRRTQSTMD